MSSKAEKRRLEILNLVNLDGVAYVSETARIFNVTSETIRSDFDFLAEHYDLNRVRGGIRRGKVPLFTQRYRYHDKKSIHVEEKRRICLRAVDLIEDGECVYIDSGSTVSYLLDFLSRKTQLTVVTPSVAGIEPAELVVVGDSASDRDFARNAGASFAGIAAPYNDFEPPGVTREVYVARIDELIPRLGL